MGAESKIEWTHSTWNPWRGCDKVDPACAHCYMFRDQERYGRDPSIVTRCSPSTFNAPLSKSWERVRAAKIAEHGHHLVFTCSWSDWFHEDADDWRDEAWDIIRRTPGSTYQILTKRDDRIADHLPADWGDGWPNVWLGVTIGNRRGVGRADSLRKIPAAVRFISAEPLLGPLIFDSAEMSREDGSHEPCWADGYRGPELDLAGIDWLIGGGESGGPKSRQLVNGYGQPNERKARWIRHLRDTCDAQGVAFLFKQWGGGTPTSGGRILDGRTWDELPTPRVPVVRR